MEWSEIIWAFVLAAMLLMLFPRVKKATQNTEKASTEDWMSFIKPMILVVLFVVALIVLS